jgi:hypothetical protein
MVGANQYKRDCELHSWSFLLAIVKSGNSRYLNEEASNACN